VLKDTLDDPTLLFDMANLLRETTALQDAGLVFVCMRSCIASACNSYDNKQGTLPQSQLGKNIEQVPCVMA
jgi:hypothetical protein